MLNIFLPGQATLKIEDAQHIPRTGHTKDPRMLNILFLGQATLKIEDAQHMLLKIEDAHISWPGQATLKIEDAQHISPRTGHTKDTGCSTYYSLGH